jgi:hypothetical protein
MSHVALIAFYQFTNRSGESQAWLVVTLAGCCGDPCDSVTGKLGLSKKEEANVRISPSTLVLSAKPLEEEAVPTGSYENASQPDRVPVVVGYADNEDEEDEEEEFDDDEDEEDDLDDLDDDEDEEDDMELDDEDLDHEWEEVVDDDEEEDEEDDEEDDEEE